jgi:DinB superfamily
MNAKEAIRTSLKSSQNMLPMFLNDLSDADILDRPVPSANHIAWQLGHLIASECRLGQQLPGAKYPELPAGFAEHHTKDTSKIDPPKGFGTKAQYLELFNKVREATLASLDRLNDADLDKPATGNVAKMAPTLGAVLLLASNHVLMHLGQFTVVRRKFGKPNVM